VSDTQLQETPVFHPSPARCRHPPYSGGVWSQQGLCLSSSRWNPFYRPGFLLLSRCWHITPSDREGLHSSFHGEVIITHPRFITETGKARLSMVNSRGLSRVQYTTLHGDEYEYPVLTWVHKIQEWGRLSCDEVSEMVRSDLGELELDESMLRDIITNCVRALRDRGIKVS